MAQSARHRRTLLDRPLSPQAVAGYERQAAESLRMQAEIEAGDDLPFEQFRQGYLAQDMMGGAHFGPL
jgi:glutamate--cysteine ligase